MLEKIRALIVTVCTLIETKANAVCMHVCVCVYVHTHTHTHIFTRPTQQMHNYYFRSYFDRLNPVVQMNNSNAKEATCFSHVVSNHQA
jgi:hypothetical protein